MTIQLIAAVSVLYGTIFLVFGLYKIVRHWRRDNDHQRLVDRINERRRAGWDIFVTADWRAYHGVQNGQGRLIFLEPGQLAPTKSGPGAYPRLVVDNQEKE